MVFEANMDGLRCFVVMMSRADKPILAVIYAGDSACAWLKDGPRGPTLEPCVAGPPRRSDLALAQRILNGPLQLAN
jgi:hypothetical protein